VAQDHQNLIDYLHDDPRLPPAWAPWFSHEYITYFAVQAASRIMAMPPVPVKTRPVFNNVNWPVGPKHVDVYKEDYRECRHLDPLQSFNYEERNGKFASDPPTDKTIEPWKILVIYGTEPDLDPDCDLDLHKDQKITGGSHGWRHMQFRLLGKPCGMASESVRMHMALAEMSFKTGNDYWGWRYLSRCAHYLADLGNPFHVKALPVSFLIRKVFWPRELFKILSAVHQSYEVYAERRFREGFPAFKEALLRGSRAGQIPQSDVNLEIKDYMRRAEKRHNAIFYHVLDQFGTALIEVFQGMDPNSDLDASIQIKRCSADAARVIFETSDPQVLHFLDRVTAEILFDVGRILGMLFDGFARKTP